MGLAEDRGWVETDLDGAMGKLIYSEEHGFGILEATAVRFFKDGQSLPDIRWINLSVRSERRFENRRTDLGRACKLITSRLTTFAQLASATCIRIDRRSGSAREVAQAQDGVEMDCALNYYGRTPETFTVRSEEECKKLRFRLVGQVLPKPRVQDIREGGRYFYRKPGENLQMWMDVRVTKVYDFPTTDRICDVLAQDGQTYSIDRSVIFLLTLPLSGLDGYQDTPDAGEAAGIDRGVREADLQPHAVREGQTANICWQPIAGAASFRVTLYRRVDVQWPGFVPLYHLADYETDRDTHFLSVSGLVGPGLLYRVTALDRTGNELACSRGRDL